MFEENLDVATFCFCSLDRPRSSSQTRSSPVFRPSASTYSSAASAAPSTSLAAVPSTSVPSSTALSATAALQAAFPLTHRYLTEPGPLGAPAPALAPPGTGGTPAAPPRPTPEAGASAAGTGECTGASSRLFRPLETFFGPRQSVLGPHCFELSLFPIITTKQRCCSLRLGVVAASKTSVLSKGAKNANS